MRSKRLLQIFVLFVLLFSSIGVQPAHASSGVVRDAVVFDRDLNFWDATYFGFVSASIYEKWRFEFTEAHQFVITVSTLTGDLVPTLTLLDASSNEITHSVGTLTSNQPAGTYYLQVQPESGSGIYSLTIREIVNVQPSVSTSIIPTNLNVGESALVTVSLNNVPAEGYTSAEFTCTYDEALLEVGDILIGSLFGTDAATAINGPQAGSFIVAIAGSNGNKATTSGPVFAFDVTALQAGQTSVECTVRVSTGDNTLTSLPSTGADVTITGTAPTATFTSTQVESPTATSTTDPNTTATPVGSSTSTPVATSTPDGTITPVGSSTPVETTTPVETGTPVESPTPTFTFTPEVSPTPTFTETPLPSPTATALPAGSLTGKVIASKPVTINLYGEGNVLVATVSANLDGTFSITAPAGSYTVVATASGFLSAAGAATVTSGGTTSLPDVTLLAGDIDGNGVIDQLDALTIGMNYNTDTPAAADLNNDGNIDVLDLEILAGNYRETDPIVWE